MARVQVTPGHGCTAPPSRVARLSRYSAT
jgi:hypothetical protein